MTGGDISPMYIGTRAEAEPTEIPSINLETINISGFPEKPQANDPTAKIIAVIRIIIFLPHLAANGAIETPPIIAPQSSLEVIVPSSNGLISHVSLVPRKAPFIIPLS